MRQPDYVDTYRVQSKGVWAVIDRTSRDILGIADTFKGAMLGMRDARLAGFNADVVKTEYGS